MKTMKLGKNLFMLWLMMSMATITHAKLKQPLNHPTIYTEAHTNVVVTSTSPQFVLKLKSNPTTGYSWFLREYDSNLLMTKGHHFARGNPKLMGAPSFEYWDFAVKPTAFQVPHETLITLIYARPWEGVNGASELVFHVTIMAKNIHE